MMVPVRLAIPLMILSAACGGGGDDAVPASNRLGVDILTPPPGPIVADSLTVRFGANGEVAITPATGTKVDGEAHFHLFVDAEVTPDDEVVPNGEGIYHLGDGADSVRIAIGPGAHRLIALLAWGDHVPVAGASRDTIVIEVIPPMPF